MNEQEKAAYKARMERNLNGGDQPPRNPNQSGGDQPPRVPRRGIPKKFIFGGIGVIFLLIGVVLFNQIVGKVISGTYQIKQAAITGDMSAHMKPGWFGLMFGDAIEWPKSETYFATSDKDTEDDIDEDLSIAAQFNEGSKVKISATARIIMPTDQTDAINVVNVYSYRTYESLRDKHILPILRKAVRNTASLMTAKESYATKRTDFQVWVQDQLENGMYVLSTKYRKVKLDETCIESVATVAVKGKNAVKKNTCEMKDEPYKVIKEDANGQIVREDRAFLPGLSVLNFEVKGFKYGDKVKAQIEEQQKAMMAVQTAIANAKLADQNRLEEEAKGKKRVAIAKYKELEESTKQIVIAEREKKVQELNAERDRNVAEQHGTKRKNVAKLDQEAAAFTKQEQILLGEGEAKRKRLVMMADGALKQKLDAIVVMNKDNANAYAQRAVPAYVVYGGSGAAGSTDMETKQFQQLVNMKMMEVVGLDMTVKKSKNSVQK